MLTLTREFYVPAGIEPMELGGGGGDATVYSWDTEGDGSTFFHALCFHGKAAKPDVRLWFRTDESRSRALANYLDGRRRTVNRRAERKVERSAPHTLKVGDILDSSWGYDQTNIDYYEVVRVVGPHTVEIRELAQERTDTAFMQGDCVPVPGKYIGPVERHAANASNSVKVRDFGVWASPWDGRMNHWTAYA
jgi:hypothetical protein